MQAGAINRPLTELSVKCAKEEGVRDYFHVAVNPASFPPIVLNLTDGESTDGESTDGDPTASLESASARSPASPGCRSARTRPTTGPALLFNLHVSDSDDTPTAFPGSEVCEDAVCVLPDHQPFSDEPVDGPVTVSVCDGATESVPAKDWAELLAAESAEWAHRAGESGEFFAGGSTYEEFATAAVSLWEPWLEGYSSRRAERGRPLKWYKQAKLAGGAYATLLTVHVAPSEAPGT